MIDIMRRCAEEPHLCGAPTKQILEKEGGIWSNELNPFADHFKVVILYLFNLCTFGHRFLSPPAPVTGFLGSAVPLMQAVASTSREERSSRRSSMTWKPDLVLLRLLLSWLGLEIQERGLWKPVTSLEMREMGG